MDIRKFIIVLCLFMSLPVQAQQFKQWGGEIVNKQAVTHVRLQNDGVTLYYGAGSGNGYLYYTTVKCKTAQERNQKFREVYTWLNQKD